MVKELPPAGAALDVVAGDAGNHQRLDQDNRIRLAPRMFGDHSLDSVHHVVKVDLTDLAAHLLHHRELFGAIRFGRDRQGQAAARQQCWLTVLHDRLDVVGLVADAAITHHRNRQRTFLTGPRLRDQHPPRGQRPPPLVLQSLG